MPASRRHLILSVLVLIVLAGHLPGLASTLEDLDSFKFALGLRDLIRGNISHTRPGTR